MAIGSSWVGKIILTIGKGIAGMIRNWITRRKLAHEEAKKAARIVREESENRAAQAEANMQTNAEEAAYNNAEDASDAEKLKALQTFGDDADE